MEKLSLEKFREYCKFTQEIYEIIRDEEKMNSMTEEDAEKLQEDMEKMVEIEERDLAKRFDEDLKVTIQDLGWRSEGRYLPQQSDMISVAYWYQTEPHNAFKLPEKNDLEVN